jgi:hypothetical protein
VSVRCRDRFKGSIRELPNGGAIAFDRVITMGYVSAPHFSDPFLPQIPLEITEKLLVTSHSASINPWFPESGAELTENMVQLLLV